MPRPLSLARYTQLAHRATTKNQCGAQLLEFITDRPARTRGRGLLETASPTKIDCRPVVVSLSELPKSRDCPSCPLDRGHPPLLTCG
jgi:hypothetical protein